MEWTPTRIQLHAMRVKLGRMLDQCHGMCEYATMQNVVSTHCKTCQHAKSMQEAMKRIEAMQRKDRKQRGVKATST